MREFCFSLRGMERFVPPEGSASGQRAAGQKRQRIMGSPPTCCQKYAYS